MQNIICYIASAFLFIILCQHLTFSERRCRCLSNDPSCWPNASVWQSFNTSINGRLISVQPSAAVCNSNPPNMNACNITATRWTDAGWRSDQSGAMQNHNWENSSCSVTINSSTCNQGSVPILGVDAILPQHVQATLELVRTHNLRLVIKNTGHDFLGRSTTFGSLLLWLHHMKNKTLIESFPLCNGGSVSNVIQVDAGVQWGEVYNWLAGYNLTAIGGASGSVGAVGGFLQGGGHGPLTRWKGMAADQVIEFDVIMADGRHETVNACKNSDLFWALRGGGGGTFAVVLSVVLRTYASPFAIGSFPFAIFPDETRYTSFIHHFVQLLPTLADAGWSGYFYLTSESFTGAFLMPNGDMEVANATIHQLLNNYTEFHLTEPAVHYFPSFYSLFVTVFEPNNPTGNNVLMSSRLIPEEIIRTQSNQVADAFLQARSPNKSVVIGHLVAGGQVSNIPQDNSVSPAWRTALLHMIFSQSWSDGTSVADQQRIAEHVSKKVEILQSVAGGSLSGSYMNEADLNEPNWQQKFFGTIAIYNRLKEIKNAVDPNGIFICKNCVGSDDWSNDLNCPKISIANKTNLTFKLLFFLAVCLFFLL